MGVSREVLEKSLNKGCKQARDCSLEKPWRDETLHLARNAIRRNELSKIKKALTETVTELVDKQFLTNFHKGQSPIAHYREVTYCQ